MRAKEKGKKKRGIWIFSVLIFGAIVGITVTWLVKPEWFRPPEALTLSAVEPIWGQLQIVSEGPFTVGSPIRIVVEIETKETVKYGFPDLSRVLPDSVEVIRTGLPIQVQNLPGGVRQRLAYDLVCWKSGKLALPPLTISYTDKDNGMGKYLIPGRLIMIDSVLPSKPASELLTLDIKGTKKPAGLPVRYVILPVYLSIIGLWIGLFLYYKRLQAHRDPVTIEPVREIPSEPADQVALRRLSVLKNTSLFEKNDFLIFYTELSECLRRYMEDRFQIMALEMTTEEFLSDLTRKGCLNAEQQAKVRDFLLTSDLVKFAKDCPDREEALRALNEVEQLILSTRNQEAFNQALGQPPSRL